ncbi:hypothetical protein [Myxococcus eversor]|uniref:hypothetical protein n=1 Tax=Myxococcus eversor TaxID=2709661 RepID=UPI0013D4B290|nr:hypothetical protein [Myxococcus eversor]
MTRKVAIDEEQVRAFLTEVFEDDLHVKRILSLSHATLGTVQATSLSVAAIGKAMAWARGEDVTSKPAVKQVDRLLSNGGINVWKLFAAWVPFVLAERTEAVIALDWTDFEKDDQESLVASLITRHGRATPLVWTTLVKSASVGNRQLVEDQTLQRLREVIASHVKVTIVADRGFADSKFYALLRQLDFEYVVRFRADMLVTSEKAETKPAVEWVPEGGRAKVLRNARVTTAMAQVGAVVCVKRKGMKDSWCLATSFTGSSPESCVVGSEGVRGRNAPWRHQAAVVSGVDLSGDMSR